MSGVTIQQMADRIAELLGDRLKLHDKTLDEKLGRGGRLLPRRVRAEAQYLAKAAEQAQMPKLQKQIDYERATVAYDTCVRYLKPLGRGARRKAILLNIATSLALVVLLTGGLVITVLALRGYI